MRIENNNGGVLGITDTDSIASYGSVPFWKVGARCDDAMTSQEALKLGKLDWDVYKVPIKTSGFSMPGGYFDKSGQKDPAGELCNYPFIHEGDQAIDGWYATMRSDTQETLGLVGSRWTPVQNRDAFAFMDGLVMEKLAMYHVVGSLMGGKRVWLLAKIPDTIRIGNTDDIIEEYLLLCNGHDGTLSFRTFFTPIRVVCNNTLNAAIKGASVERGVVFRHDTRVMRNIDQAREILGLAGMYYSELGSILNAMAKYEPTQDEVDTVVNKLIPIPIKDLDKENNQKIDDRVAIKRLFRAGIGNDIAGIKNSAYALYNGITEFYDHAKRVNSKTFSQEEAQLNSIWFGQGATMKERGFELIKELVCK